MLTQQDLISALEQEVWRADQEEQLALLRAHPDLGTRVRMTDHSVQEQSGAGLNQLTPEEYEQFLSLINSIRIDFSSLLLWR